jgi:hypothetical protein
MVKQNSNSSESKIVKFDQRNPVHGFRVKVKPSARNGTLDLRFILNIALSLAAICLLHYQPSDEWIPAITLGLLSFANLNQNQPKPFFLVVLSLALVCWSVSFEHGLFLMHLLLFTTALKTRAFRTLNP